MKLQREYILQISPSGDDVSDAAWRQRWAGHVDTWKQAVELLRSSHMSVRGEQVDLSVDWSPILRSAENYCDTMDRIEKHISIHGPVSWYEKIRFQRRRTCVPCTVVVNRRAKTHDASLLYLKAFFYRVFLEMNIADPGCLDLYRSVIKPDDDHGAKLERRPTEFSLSAVHFDVASLRAVDGHWPSTTRLPLETVTKWWDSNDSGAARTPKSRAEKVLYGLWHLCSDDLSHTSIIWIFYCLETLLNTRANENRRALFERICLMLKPNERQAGYIKRKMDELYEYRSGLVHGGLEVYHPLQFDAVDPGAETKYARLMSVIDFGFAVLLTVLQRTIEQGWRAPRFVTSLAVEDDR